MKKKMMKFDIVISCLLVVLLIIGLLNDSILLYISLGGLIGLIVTRFTLFKRLKLLEHEDFELKMAKAIYKDMAVYAIALVLAYIINLWSFVAVFIVLLIYRKIFFQQFKNLLERRLTYV